MGGEETGAVIREVVVLMFPGAQPSRYSVEIYGKQNFDFGFRFSSRADGLGGFWEIGDFLREFLLFSC